MSLHCVILLIDHILLFGLFVFLSEKNKSSWWWLSVLVVAVVIIGGRLVYIRRRKFAPHYLLDEKKTPQPKGTQLPPADSVPAMDALPSMDALPAVGSLPATSALPTKDTLPLLMLEMTENHADETKNVQTDHICEMTSNVAYGAVVPNPGTTTVVEVPADTLPGKSSPPVVGPFPMMDALPAMGAEPTKDNLPFEMTEMTFLHSEV